MRSDIFVGLEIGTSKTCMVVGEVKADSSVRILGVGNTPSAGVRKGEIVDLKKVRACLKEALHQAENEADVNIGAVLLSVSGSHIQSFNHSGTYRLRDDEREIDETHIDEAREMAKDAPLPAGNCLLHPITRNFTVDGKDEVSNPFGMVGRTLDSECHIIHGISTRIETSIKAVREMPLEVDDIVYAPIASALSALTRDQKEEGALVIDMGGGTTDFALYLRGVIAASGTIPVGGDHVTNDIHLIEKIPPAKAEEVKITEGDATASAVKSVGKIRVTDELGMIDLEIDRLRLNQIIRGRLEETLKLIIKRLPKDALKNLGAGVFITGGGSRMAGFGELAEEMFGVPVYQQVDHHGISGVQNLFREPEYSTAIGLIRYAQFVLAERPNTKITSKLGQFFKGLMHHR